MSGPGSRNAEAVLAGGRDEERRRGRRGVGSRARRLFPYCEGKPSLLFTGNETNNQRIFGTANAGPYVKDGINDFIVAGRRDAVNPGLEGTKAAARYQLDVGPGETAMVRLRLTKTAPDSIGDPFGGHSRRCWSAAGGRPTNSTAQ